MNNAILGATVTASGTEFSIWSHHAEGMDLCLFDGAGQTELQRLQMEREEDGTFHLLVEGVGEGTRYGYRAHGRYAPDEGFWFDPAKLLVDPYAKELDRPFRHDARLAIFGDDTADLVPKSIVTRDVKARIMMPFFQPGGIIYEIAVRPFTILHPDLPEDLRGTVAALGHPLIIAHLKRIGVDTIELMPITAWIDERHLPPLGLTNSWGYNPVALMALDPRLVPGGMAELRDTVTKLHAEGIGVILDLVFNHSGESDRQGATLSMRGIDNLSYYRHLPGNPGALVNDTGCGNTLASDHPRVRQLIIDSLRHFVLHAGIDGFRFDLAPILGRTSDGFDGAGETLRAITANDILEDRVLIAEPWDIGPGGYQLGNFPEPFLEWNDRARDTIRRFWRGDAHMTGSLATALAGSSDIFGRHGRNHTRSVNFVAAHDGFTLMDLVSHDHKHNDRNGEDNRDGHNENYSWNNGVEGLDAPKPVLKQRKVDIQALLSTLFATRGAIMLTSGDEGGRTQQGNNNAYCQDNEITWLDWSRMNNALIDLTSALATMRKRFTAFSETAFFDDERDDVEWISASGEPMTVPEWESADGAAFGMILRTTDTKTKRMCRLAVLFNRDHGPIEARLPSVQGKKWRRLHTDRTATKITLKPRSVEFFVET